MWSNFLADTLWYIPQSIIGVKDEAYFDLEVFKVQVLEKKWERGENFFFCCVGYPTEYQGVNKVLQYYTAIAMEAYFDVDLEVFCSVLW